MNKKWLVVFIGTLVSLYAEHQVVFGINTGTSTHNANFTMNTPEEDEVFDLLSGNRDGNGNVPYGTVAADLIFMVVNSGGTLADGEIGDLVEGVQWSAVADRTGAWPTTTAQAQLKENGLCRVHHAIEFKDLSP